MPCIRYLCLLRKQIRTMFVKYRIVFVYKPFRVLLKNPATRGLHADVGIGRNFGLLWPRTKNIFKRSE